jgi:NAD-specific glutamate dehydrogenase
MTDEVAALVLRNNYLQTLALSLAERRGLEDLGFQQRLMQTLGAAWRARPRRSSILPDDMEIAERGRRQQPLTRPELSVLLAYAKLSLYADLLDSNVPDDPYLGRELGRYFPKLIAQKYPDALEKHRLRREIIATQLANSMINRGGPSLVVRIADQTGASPAAIAAAFAAVRNSYDMPAAERRDQRARRQGAGEGAAQALRRRRRLAARPPGLVPPQCRSVEGPGRSCRALSRGHYGADQGPRQGAASRGRRRPRGAYGGADPGRRAGGARAPHRRYSRDHRGARRRC